MKTITLMLFLGIGTLNFYGQTSETKAKFIYGITKYIEWPEKHDPSGMFTIGVVGDFDLYKSIADISMGRAVKNHNIEAMNIAQISQINLFTLDILVVAEKYCTDTYLAKIKNSLKNQNTLIITEKQDFYNPLIGVGFKTTGSSMGFCYNPGFLRSRNIQYSKQLDVLGGSCR